MSEEIRREFVIPKSRMEELNKRLKKIKDKCEKYNCAFNIRQIDEITKIMISDMGIKYEIRLVKIEVQGTAIINGWKFIGMLEHLEKGNLFKACWGNNIPEKYRNQKGICEHCGSNRRRKKTYIIQNIKSGEFKQVGGACLKDYTQGWSAEKVASMMEFIETLETMSQERINYDEEYARKARVFNTGYAVKMAFLLKDRGVAYRNRNGEDVPSYNLLLGLLKKEEVYDKNIRKIYDRIGVYESKHVDMGKYESAIKEYMNQEVTDTSSEYLKNVRVLLRNEYCSLNNLGLIAYLPYAVEKYIESKKEESIKRDGESEWLYNVGDKVELKHCYIRELYRGKNWYSGNMDITYRIIQGCNVYIWRTTKVIKSGNYDVKGTVKDNTLYHGEKQTYLTRCKVDICKE